jgi:hypothetical protein
MNVKKWLAMAVLFLLVVAPTSALSQATQSQSNTSTPQTGATPTQQTPSPNQQTAAPPRSKPHTYTNSAGQKVQSPTRSKTVPEGATAQCRDGSYSFSQNRRGTCSHHGGVRHWLTQ